MSWPLLWEHGVLATRPPGTSQIGIFSFAERVNLLLVLPVYFSYQVKFSYLEVQFGV